MHATTTPAAPRLPRARSTRSRRRRRAGHRPRRHHVTAGSTSAATPTPRSATASPGPDGRAGRVELPGRWRQLRRVRRIRRKTLTATASGRGNYPEPREDLPLGLPYTAFRWTGALQGDGGYFIPSEMDEQYDYYRRSGQSRCVAWDMTRAWVEQQLSDLFGSPLTYYGVTVIASREGIDLGTANMGTDVSRHRHRVTSSTSPATWRMRPSSRPTTRSSSCATSPTPRSSRAPDHAARLLQPAASRRRTPRRDPTSGLVAWAWVMAVLLPLVGFILGAHRGGQGTHGHGVATMSLAVAMVFIWPMAIVAILVS